MEVTETSQTAKIQARAVEKLLSYSALAIEAGWGLRLLNAYLSELTLLESNVPYAALGISERRHASRAVQVISPDGAIISDPYLIRNEGLTPAGSIAVLQLQGVMSSVDDISTDGTPALAQKLRAAYANRNIEAVILETNSGGGEVTAMQILVTALEERNKPVIGWGHFAASAAYGTLAATDEIIASNKMAEFGSVGAVISLDKRFIEFYRENVLSFYGKDAPMKNKEWRELLAGNSAPMQVAADEVTENFQKQVSSQRALTGGQAYQRATLSGDMFGAVEARRRGLIDGIGNMNYAIARAEAWAAKMNKKRKRA